MREQDTLISRKILVVDDHKDAAHLLELVLGKHGHKVKIALNGKEGADLFEEFEPEIVLLDISLPDIDGFEVCRRMRLVKRKKPAIIIAQTGWGGDENRQKAFDAGFDLYLVKPVRASDIFAVIEQQI